MKKTIILFLILITLTANARYIADYDERDLNQTAYDIEETTAGTPLSYGDTPQTLETINQILPSFGNISFLTDGNITITNNKVTSTITLGLSPDANISTLNIQDLNSGDANFVNIGVAQGTYLNRLTATGTGFFGGAVTIEKAVSGVFDALTLTNSLSDNEDVIRIVAKTDSDKEEIGSIEFDPTDEWGTPPQKDSDMLFYIRNNGDKVLGLQLVKTGDWDFPNGDSLSAITIKEDVAGDFDALIIRNMQDNPTGDTVRVQAQFKSTGLVAGSLGWLGLHDFGLNADRDSGFFITTRKEGNEVVSFNINDVGNVLIGASAVTDEASAKLDVNGTIQAKQITTTGDVNIGENVNLTNANDTEITFKSGTDDTIIMGYDESANKFVIHKWFSEPNGTYRPLGSFGDLMTIDILGNMALNPSGFSAGGKLSQFRKGTSGGGEETIFEAGLTLGGGAGQAGDALAYEFKIENDSGSATLPVVAKWIVGWTDPSAGSEYGFTAFYNVINGSPAKVLELDNMDTIVYGNLEIQTDNKKLLFGAGQDASIYFNGLDLRINPKEVGSGGLQIDSDVNILEDLNVLGIISGDPVFAEMWSADAALVKAHSHEVTDGTITSEDDTNSTKFADGNYFVVNESGQFKIDLNYLTVSIPEIVVFAGRYEGNPAHDVKLKIWNFNTEVYDDVTADADDFPSSSENSVLFFSIPKPVDIYASSGKTALRIEHESAAVGSHNFYIDVLEIIQSTTTIPNVGEYMDVNGFQDSQSNNMTVNASTGTITAIYDGFYNVSFVSSFIGETDTIFESALFVNGNEMDSCEFVRSINQVGDVGSASFNCIIDSKAGDTFVVRVKDFDVNTFMAMNTGNFNVKRLN